MKNSPVGATGRIVGTTAAGLTGEVMVPIRGGAETFYSYPLDPSERFEIGTLVYIAEYDPPRSVRVISAQPWSR